MKILIISRGYPTARKPLDGNFEVSQAKALRDAGHEVIVAYVRIRSFYRMRLRGFSHWEDNGITVCEFSELFPIIPKLSHIPFTPVSAPHVVTDAIYALAMKCLWREVVALKGVPDVVHTHYLFVSGFAGFVKTRYNVPLVCTEHWSELTQQSITARNQRLGKVYCVADAVVAVSDSLSKNLAGHFRVESRVIPNLLDDMFLKDTGKAQAEKRPFSFLTIGRLDKIKCYDLLIHAFAKAQLPDHVRLVIVGDGEEYARLNHLVSSLGLAGRIHFLKQKTMAEINDLLGQYDVFVSSSRKETFGVVHIEAMAKGLPVLSTRSGGPDDFITREVGILIEPDNVDSLTDGLEKMYNGYDNYNAGAIRNYCIGRFAPAVVARQITDLYLSVLQNRRVDGERSCAK